MTYKSKEIYILNDQYCVEVVIGTDRDVRKCLENRGYPKDTELGLESVMGMTYFFEGCDPVIALPRFPKTPEDMGTLAHEAVHATDYIFEYIREGKTKEIFAHSV